MILKVVNCKFTILLAVSITVSLCPSVTTLCSTLYLTISTHIPQLLRQWYLTLDHQYSSIVSKLVIIMEYSITFIYPIVSLVNMLVINFGRMKFKACLPTQKLAI